MSIDFSFLSSSAPIHLDALIAEEVCEPSDSIHHNLKLLSHSSCDILHACPRKYELYKLMSSSSIRHRDPTETVDLDYGDVVGRGVQEYFVSASLDKAYMEILKHWPNSLDDDSGKRSKKTFWHALHAIDNFIGFRKTVLSGYDLVYVDDKPAIELGFSIDCGNGFKYRGFLDALLIHRMRRELVPYEGKTTKSLTPNEASYKNSGQALGYSLIVDAICRKMKLELKSSFNVLYSIYSTSGWQWHEMRFQKNHVDRALWIKNLLIDIAHVEQYAQMDYFPQHGESCFGFGRQCGQFGTCHMSNKFLIGPMDKVEVKVDDPSKYQFHFHIEELIQSQLELGA